MKRRRFNWVVSDVSRRVLKHYLNGYAAPRQAVSLPGAGRRVGIQYHHQLRPHRVVQLPGLRRLGAHRDLNKASFKDVFFGPVAQRFRDQLAQGKLPIMTCTRCGDLQRVPKSQPIPKPRLPYKGMLLENTVRCNIDCIGCDRQSAARIRTTLQM